MGDNAQAAAPRILHWAEAVKKLEGVLNNDMFWLTQNDQMQRNISAHKCVLLGIYQQFWADKDIGYPDLLEIVKRWEGAEIAPSFPQEPIKAIRMIELVMLSIELDIAVELYNQEFVTPPSVEKEMILGKED